MRFLLCLLACLMIAPAAEAVRPLPKPQLLAVYFYADWCPNCKLLSPKVQEARAKDGLDNKEVLFITLNLTDKASIHQSVMMAQALGIADFVQAQGSATGYVALLDATTKKEIARFDRQSDSAAIGKSILQHLTPES